MRILVALFVAGTAHAAPQENDGEMPRSLPPKVVLSSPTRPAPPDLLPCWIPPHAEYPRRWEMFAGGAMMFAVPWTVGGILGVRAQEYELLIPVAGPFIDMRHTRDGEFGGLIMLPLLLSGLAQAAGLALGIAGISTHHRVDVPGHFELRPNGGAF
jgi:hypothetical protein